MRTDGGHAFPNITPDMPVDGGPGMSLRDYFAAKAMQGAMAMCAGSHINSGTNEELAKAAYAIADAMLAERAKESRR